MLYYIFQPQHNQRFDSAVSFDEDSSDKTLDTSINDEEPPSSPASSIPRKSSKKGKKGIRVTLNIIPKTRDHGWYE